MAVDYGILFRTPSVGERYMEGLQMRQADAERNMLRQAQMQQMAMQQENMLAQRAERMAMAADREEQTRARRAALEQQNALAEYVRSGMPQGVAGFSQFGEAGLRTAKALREAEAADLDKQLKTLDYVSRNLAAATPETYGAIRADISRISPQFGQVLPAEFNPEQVAALAQRGMSLKDQIESKTKQTVVSPGATVLQGGKPIYTAPEKPQTYTPSPDMQGYELAKSEGYKGTFFDYQRQLAEAKRPPAQPKSPGTPVAVIDPDTGKTVFVTPEEALRRRMTPASAGEGLSPKQRQLREAEYPKATASIKSFELTADTLINDLKTLATHPGLDSITGLVAGRVPAITAEGREAEALLDKIKARAGFQELNALRQAGPSGGALGNVSNTEGAKLEQAAAALDRRQDAPSVRKAIAAFIAQTEVSKKILRDAYDLTYEYRAGGGARPSLDEIFK